ncbi:MAG: hypothetical protein ABL888_09040 [Pirellulaceae bacterium]
MTSGIHLAHEVRNFAGICTHELIASPRPANKPFITLNNRCRSASWIGGARCGSRLRTDLTAQGISHLPGTKHLAESHVFANAE